METLLYVFQNKLPCKFRYIPNHIQKHIIIKQRKIEMMVKYCKVLSFMIALFYKIFDETIIFHHYRKTVQMM